MFFGESAGQYATTGIFNTYFGYAAGRGTLGCYTGGCNTFIGKNTGCNIGSGNNNIAIGHDSGSPAGGLCTITTGSNIIIMGNSSHTVSCIQTAWSAASDIRDKCVYGEVPYGRTFLQNVNPIKYSFKDRETGEVTDDRKRYGFSAQEIASLEDEPILVADPDSEKIGITHEYLLPILVNAVKELDAENKELRERLTALEEKVNRLLDS